MGQLDSACTGAPTRVEGRASRRLFRTHSSSSDLHLLNRVSGRCVMRFPLIVSTRAYGTRKTAAIFVVVELFFTVFTSFLFGNWKSNLILSECIICDGLMGCYSIILRAECLRRVGILELRVKLSPVSRWTRLFAKRGAIPGNFQEMIPEASGAVSGTRRRCFRKPPDV
jgi:hypothetical protein